MTGASPPPGLSRGRRSVVLAAAFLAWMFAGLEIALFVLVHRQMTHGLLGPDTPVSSAIIGFGSPAHVEEVARIPFGEPLPADLAPFIFG